MRVKRLLIGALVAGSLLGSAVGVSASADPNNNGSNCHGVSISGGSTAGYSPGQVQKASDGVVSAKDQQGDVRSYCSVGP